MEKFKDIFYKTNIQGLIALIIIVGGFLFLAFVTVTDVINTTVGNLMIMVVSYYFGSSRSTAKKDETIANFIDKPDHDAS